MALQQQQPDGSLRVRWVDAEGIRVDNQTYPRSFLLTPEAVDTDWSPGAVDDIGAAELQRLIDRRPQVLIVGTGERQCFLPPQSMAALMRHGIGLECMDNAAAARTFNLLADEGRQVAALFLLPGA